VRDGAAPVQAEEERRADAERLAAFEALLDERRARELAAAATAATAANAASAAVARPASSSLLRRPGTAT